MKFHTKSQHTCSVETILHMKIEGPRIIIIINKSKEEEGLILPDSRTHRWFPEVGGRSGKNGGRGSKDTNFQLQNKSWGCKDTQTYNRKMLLSTMVIGQDDQACQILYIQI